MKYLLSHRTSYTYASSVDSAHHIAHLRARAVSRPEGHLDQHRDQSACRRWRCSMSTISATSIDIYRIDKPHTRFDIEVRAAVEVSFPDPPPADVDAAVGGDPRGAERRRLSRRRSRRASSSTNRRWCRSSRRCKAYGASRSRRAGRSSRRRASSPAHQGGFRISPGATDISTPLAEVFAGKARRLPGFRPCRDRGAARPRPRRGLRLGLHPHRPFQGGDRAARRRCQPRLGRGVVRRAGGLGPSRSDQRPGRQARTTSPSPGAATSPT